MKLVLPAVTLLTLATAAVAQQITPVWFEHLNANQGVAPANLLPILRKNLNKSENNNGTSEQVSFGKLLPYDATRLLLFVRENGINEPSATPEDLALAALYPDRSLIWINASSGAPMGIAKVIGIRPVPITGQSSDLDFFNEYGLDEDGNIYYGHKNKIIRYAKTGVDTWAATPTCAWNEPTVGAKDCAGNDLDGSTAGDGNQGIRWREFRVTGKGTNTVLFCGGGTWRAGCQPQKFITTNGVDFLSVARVNNRNESGTRGNYALGGQSSHVVQYGWDATRPNLMTAYTAHFPGTGYGARPQRYQTDPDNPEHFITPYSYSLNDTCSIMWLDEVATNGIPKFVWEAAGKDGLPEDKFQDGNQYYDGNWCNILDTDASLDYIVSYSMPSWDNQYGQVDGTNWHRPGWIGVHRLDGSISPNGAWKMACTEADIANSDNGGVGNDWGYCGDVTVIPDTTAPANLKKSKFFWVGGGYGFGVFTVENVGASITTEPPTSITVNELDPITISAVVTGTPNAYQWSKGGVALDGAKTNVLDGSIYYPPTVLQGVKKPKLFIAQSRASDSGIYKLTIVNPITGTTTSRDVNVTVVPDTAPPTVTSVASMGDASGGYQTVDVQFNKTLDLGGTDPTTDPGTARNAANYTIVTPSGGTVSTADLRKNGKAVRLTVSGVLPATAFSVKVVGVRNYTRAANTAILAPGQTVSGAVQSLIALAQDCDTSVIGTTYTMAPGEYEVEAGGTDIWGASDVFHYGYKMVTGDFDVSVQVVQSTSPGNRNGIMLREGGFGYVDGAARFNYVTFYQPANYLGFHVRETASVSPVWGNPQQNWMGFVAPPNVWLRLQRVGTLTSAYYGTDGQSWTAFGTTTNVIADPALLGLATCSGGNLNLGFTKYASYGTTVVHGKLSVSSAGGVFTLSWTGPGVLKSAASLSGPFTTESSQANPQVITPTGTQKFFRLE